MVTRMPYRGMPGRDPELPGWRWEASADDGLAATEYVPK